MRSCGCAGRWCEHNLMTCQASRHGGYNDYRNRGCRCPTARTAWRRYRKTRHLARPSLISVIPTRRRLRALQAIGYSGADLARLMGRNPRYSGDGLGSLLYGENVSVTRVVADRVRVIYAEYAGIPGPSNHTRGWARRNGLIPPSGWVDIDDLDEDPRMVLPIGLDEVVVERLVAAVVIGCSPMVEATRAELAEARVRLVGLRVSAEAARPLLASVTIR